MKFQANFKNSEKNQSAFDRLQRHLLVIYRTTTAPSMDE